MDLQRAQAFLASVGYPSIVGVTFDFAFAQADGLRGVALLHDGRQVRFYLPDDPADRPVINVLAKEHV